MNAAMCAMCFQDWHENCPDHKMLGECCCGGAGSADEDDEDEWPMTDQPAWWQVIAVVLLIGGLGGIVGWIVAALMMGC